MRYFLRQLILHWRVFLFNRKRTDNRFSDTFIFALLYIYQTANVLYIIQWHRRTSTIISHSKFKSGLIIVCFHLNQEYNKKKREKGFSFNHPTIMLSVSSSYSVFPIYIFPCLYYWSWWLHNKYWYITLKKEKW